RPLVPTAVDQPVQLEADRVRDAPSWRRRGDSGPLFDIEHHHPRNEGVWRGNELLRGESSTISRPQKGTRFDRQGAAQRLARRAPTDRTADCPCVSLPDGGREHAVA